MQRWKRRVDLQVSLLTAVIVFLSSSIVFILCYSYTYNGMISELKERVHAIVSYVNTSLDPLTFTEIHDRDDMASPLYHRRLSRCAMFAAQPAFVIYIRRRSRKTIP